MGTLKLSDFWFCPVPTKTKAPKMEQRLFSEQLSMVTLKLSDFWLPPVPIKTKAPQMMEQRLYLQLLTMVILKLSDFWLPPVPIKTKAPQIMEQRLFSEQLRTGTLKLSDFWLSPVPTRTKAPNMEQRLCMLHVRVVTLKLSDFSVTPDRKTECWRFARPLVEACFCVHVDFFDDLPQSIYYSHASRSEWTFPCSISRSILMMKVRLWLLGWVHLHLKMTFWKCRLHPGHLKSEVAIWSLLRRWLFFAEKINVFIIFWHYV